MGTMVGSLESGGVLLTQAADMFERGGRRLRGGARRIGPGAITEGEQETNAGNALIHDCEAQLGTEDTRWRVRSRWTIVAAIASQELVVEGRKQLAVAARGPKRQVIVLPD